MGGRLVRLIAIVACLLPALGVGIAHADETPDPDPAIEVTITAAPEDGNRDGTPTVEFESAAEGVTFTCRSYATDTEADQLPPLEPCVSPLELPLLDRNTEYTFEVKGIDQDGAEGSASATWTQANTAPVPPTLDLTLEAGSSVVLPLLASDADGDALAYSPLGSIHGGVLGEIDPETGDVTFTADGGAYGDHDLGFEVTDHRDGGTVPFTVTLHIQPDTVFSLEPPARTSDPTPTWEFGPADADEIICRLIAPDDPEPSPFHCSAGAFTPDEDLADGTYTLEAVATIDGLTDPTPAASTVTVDTVAPVVEIAGAPEALSNEAAPTFTFETDEDGPVSYECAVDGTGVGAPEPAEGEEPAAWGACESGLPLPALGDGAHQLRVRATDAAGNVGEPVGFDWEVDATAPAIALGGAPEGVGNGPAEGRATNARRPVWYFQSADPHLLGESVRCRIDAGPWTEATCLSPFQPTANLADGTHAFEVQADDAAGNTGSLTTEFAVDTVAPSVLITDAPASPSGPHASISFEASSDLGPEGSFACRVGAEDAAAGPWEPCASPLSLDDLASGPHSVEIKAIDSAGNESTGAQVAGHSWIAVGGMPETAITGATANGASAAFGFRAAGYPLASFECRLDDGEWESCSSPKSYSGLGAGEHTFEVRATNRVGVVEPTPARHTWSVEAPAAPDTFVDARPSAETTATGASFRFSSSLGLASFECRLDDGAWEPCASPVSYGDLAPGDHGFQVRAVAPGGPADASPASVVWKVIEAHIQPDEPPVCDPEQPKPVKSGSRKVARKLKVSVRLSHRRAIEGQKVTVKVLVNGKRPGAKAKKRLSRALKRIRIKGRDGVVATLKGGKWRQAKFTAGADTRSALVVQMKRRKGGSERTTVPFTLTACDG